METAAADLPRTMGGLREAHLRLLREWRKIAIGEQLERARLVRMIAQEAGANIADFAERDEAQGIIDYWASAISGLPEQEFPSMMRLAPYQGETATRAGASAQQTFDALDGEEDRRAARVLFEELIVQRDGGIARAPGRTRAMLQQRIGGDRVDSVIALFAGCGAIGLIESDDPADDRIEISDVRMVENWPALSEWLAERDRFADRRALLMARAETWKRHGRSGGYVAAGRDLKGIDQYRGQTGLLDEYIDASKRGATTRSYLVYGVGLLLAFALGLIVLLWEQNRSAESAIGTLEDKNSALIDDRSLFAPPQPVEQDIQPVDRQLQATASDTDFPSLTGYMWLGSIARPQVTAPGSNVQFTQLGAARAGTLYRARTDIFLREAPPNNASENKSAPDIGIVPNGALIVLKQPAQGFERPTGVQYWAEIQIVPRVSVQHDGLAEEAQTQLREFLAESGFDVPDFELTADARGKSEVRYFNRDDRPIARRLVERANDAPPSALPALAALQCRSFARSGVRGPPHQVELWISARPPSRGEPRVRGC